MTRWKNATVALLFLTFGVACSAGKGDADTTIPDQIAEVAQDSTDMQDAQTAPETVEVQDTLPEAGPEDVVPEHETENPDVCQPECEDKMCGEDGCGGECGTCGEAKICEDGLCEPYCKPYCHAIKCGDDGCGGSCGECAEGEICQDGKCQPECQPDCAGKECGDDGCGGACGVCEPGEVCDEGLCEDSCQPDCDDKQCGDDGCEGSCGECESKSEVCIDFVCASGGCVGQCGGSIDGCFCDELCFDYGDCCDNVCVACPELSGCCVPDCEGKTCGDDGCGDFCGVCEPGTICTEFQCVDCTADCDGKQCGADGCGGDCGTCGEGTICNDAGACEVCVPDCIEDVPCVSDGCDGFCPCPVNCADLPQGPFDPVLVPGAIASEGIAMDEKGYLVGSNIQHIFKSSYYGEAEVFVPGLKQRAGIVFIPSGELIVNDNFTGTVYRVSQDGAKTPIVTGLIYPNGLTADLDGFAYVSDETQSLVLKVDPYGFNDYEVLSDGTILHPNGVTFDPKYERLYVAGWQGDGFIWAIDKNPDGTFQPPHKWSMQLGNGLDGLEVDICGNLYVNDYSAGGMIRLPPDGASFEIVVDESFWIPNMAWGQGTGGWNPNHMFVPNGATFEVLELSLGVPGKKVPFP